MTEPIPPIESRLASLARVEAARRVGATDGERRRREQRELPRRARPQGDGDHGDDDGGDEIAHVDVTA